MAIHFSILAWEISWTQEPGRLQSMVVTKSRTWLSTQAYTHTHTHTHTPASCSRLTFMQDLQPHLQSWEVMVWHHFLQGWKTGRLCSPHLQIELWGLLDHLHAKTDNLFWISINWDFKKSNFSFTSELQNYTPQHLSYVFHHPALSSRIWISFLPNSCLDSYSSSNYSSLFLSLPSLYTS